MSHRYAREYFGMPEEYHKRYINNMAFLVGMHNKYVMLADPVYGWTETIHGFTIPMLIKSQE